MLIRRILFWSHLTSGLIAGIFVFIMSVTGVALMYENPIILAVGDSVKVEAPGNMPVLSVDELADLPIVRAAGENGVSLNFDNRDNAPVMVKAGRNPGFNISPYTGEIVENPAEAVDGFFHTLVGIHRWLAVEGENRQLAKSIMGIANLAFLFLVVSGLYLWLPKVWKWPFIRLNLFFRKSYPTAKARDYNWHHVLSIWMLIPLFLIITSATVFSYPWANRLVYAAFGEEAPTRGGRGGPDRSGDAPAGIPVNQAELVSLQSAFEAAKSYGEKPWTRISIPVPSDKAATSLSVVRHFGDRVLPRQRETLNFDLTSGEITDIETVKDMSNGRRARLFVRFLHTGEAFGLLGATLAGLASLAACFLVWTGFALSWRRLIKPLFRKKAA